ncbi:serine hydrolase [Microbacterium keratanolyticum]|uniref:serine hydrolase n=1 Tax=Microbacterium keratanolyticum TaxID=67574 RepID=UPI00363E92E5
MNDTQSPSTRPAEIDDYLDVVVPTAPVTNSAGRTVFVRSAVDRAADRNDFSLWLIEDGTARRLTEGPSDAAPTWNESTGDIVFVRPDAAGLPQLWALNPDGGAPRALTQTDPRLPQGVGAPVVSPDGTRIAFSAPVSRRADDSGVLVAPDRRYKIDGVGVRADVRNHLFQLTLASGRITRLTDGDFDATAPAYSPDGMSLAFSADSAPDAVEQRSSQVHVLDLSLLSYPTRAIGTATGVHGPLLWTSSGDAVIAVGADAPAVGHAHLLVLSLDPAIADRSLTAALDRNVMPGGPGYPGGRPALTTDGEIVFCLREGGSTEIWAVPLDGGEARPILTGQQRVVSGLAVGTTTVRAILATPTSFGEIVEVPLAAASESEPVVLTEFGAALDGVEFPAAQRRTFTISDGTTVEAFLLRDPALTGAGPLVLDVHGGPHNAWTGTQSVMQPHHADLVARGYTVLMVNPRGSDGYGESFFTAVYDAWGEADLQDFLQPIDQLVAEGIADPTQLVVTGYSYGGFMTCALTAWTDRFVAAVTGGLVADLGQFSGASTDGILLDRLEFDPHSGRARALSPLARVAEVTAPTLILHGGADLLCPVLQAEQWHAGLALAGVESELVVYPGGAHAFVLNGTPSHRVDYSRRLVAWFERHLSPLPAKSTVDPALWQRRLETVLDKYGIPGASFGVLTTTRAGVEVEVVSAGVLNAATGASAAPDALFQIGSITKTWTGVLIMQLVEEGLLDLDAPVRAVLPQFAVADTAVSASVTARQLLTHTSGIDGDVFLDTGRGDDTVERYLDALGDVVQNFAPGADWSYCNTAFGILGRMIEVLRGATWDEVLRERILEPLGLTHTTTLPEDTLRFASAVGHTGDIRDGSAAPVPHVMITRSAGPAGLISARAEDVLRFAADSIAESPVLLSRASYAAMIEDQKVIGMAGFADVQGLAWIQHEWSGHRIHGHDGGTLGQQAFLRISADAGVAVVLLTNGGLMGAAANELMRDAFRSIAGIEASEPFGPDPAGAPITEEEAAELVGTYGDAAASITVSWDGETLSAERTDSANPSGRELMEWTTSFQIVRAADGAYAATVPGMPLYPRVWRHDHPSGTLLHFGTRAFRKAQDA